MLFCFVFVCLFLETALRILLYYSPEGHAFSFAGLIPWWCAHGTLLRCVLGVGTALLCSPVSQVLFKLNSCKFSVARRALRPRCCCVGLCIWMPIHRPDEIACCVSIIISGNDDILKSCNTYTINFTILWNEAFFTSLVTLTSPVLHRSQQQSQGPFSGVEESPMSCWGALSHSLDLCSSSGSV